MPAPEPGMDLKKFKKYIAGVDDEAARSIGENDGWKEMSTGDRLNAFFDSLIVIRDIYYYDKNYRYKPKYGVGDKCVVCTDGLYYFVKVKSVLPYQCEDLEKTVPSYMMDFAPWSRKEEDQVVEYDVHGVGKCVVAQDLLYAHYWNKYKLRKDKKKRMIAGQRKALFELDKDMMATMNEQWLKEIGATDEQRDALSFASLLNMGKTSQEKPSGKKNKKVHQYPEKSKNGDRSPEKKNKKADKTAHRGPETKRKLRR